MLLNVSMFVYVLLLITYVCMFAYVLADIFTDSHIFPLSVSGKECEKRRVEEGRGNRLIQSEFLFNFMVAKGLF